MARRGAKRIARRVQERAPRIDLLTTSDSVAPLDDSDSSSSSACAVCERRTALYATLPCAHIVCAVCATHDAEAFERGECIVCDDDDERPISAFVACTTTRPSDADTALTRARRAIDAYNARVRARERAQPPPIEYRLTLVVGAILAFLALSAAMHAAYAALVGEYAAETARAARYLRAWIVEPPPPSVGEN